MALGSNGLPIMPTDIEVERMIRDFTNNPEESEAAKRDSPEAFIARMEQRLGRLRSTLVILVKPYMAFSGHTFYRVRTTTEPIRTDLHQEFSYPPNRAQQPYDRCSLPGWPAFYCAGDMATAVRETVFNTKVAYSPKMIHAYLSEWTVRAKETLRITPFTYLPLEQGSALHGLDGFLLERIAEQMRLSEYPEDQIQGCMRGLRFFMDAFVKDTLKSVSSYIAYNQLHANAENRPDALLYPSIATKMRKTCYAFHPNSVAKLKLARVYHIILDNMDPHSKKFTFQFWEAIENHDGVLIGRKLNYDESHELGKRFEAAFQEQAA